MRALNEVETKGGFTNTPSTMPQLPLLGPEAKEQDERDRADQREAGGKGGTQTGNGFAEQIEGVEQRRAGIPLSSLVSLASKHALAFNR